MLNRVLVVLLVATLPTAVLAASKTEKKQADIRQMQQEVLTKLYSEKAGTKAEVAGAEGYAVFSNLGINLFLVSTGSGKGIAHDNKSGKDTFMKMFSGGVGIGLGVKNFSAVFVFHTRAAFDQFVEKGWDFSGQADAAAETKSAGGSAEAAADIGSGVTVYQMTEAGLALQATLQGTKYWQNDKLNK
jgi:lipid-binding SYLF domain-containing protein